MKGLLTRIALALVASLLLQSAGLAHEVRPAYLRIQQTGAEQFDHLEMIVSLTKACVAIRCRIGVA